MTPTFYNTISLQVPKMQNPHDNAITKSEDTNRWLSESKQTAPNSANNAKFVDADPLPSSQNHRKSLQHTRNCRDSTLFLSYTSGILLSTILAYTLFRSSFFSLSTRGPISCIHIYKTTMFSHFLLKSKEAALICSGRLPI